MNYVHKVLLPGEEVVYETGLHWLVYGRAILLAIVAIALALRSHITVEPVRHPADASR